MILQAWAAATERRRQSKVDVLLTSADHKSPFGSLYMGSKICFSIFCVFFVFFAFLF